MEARNLLKQFVKAGSKGCTGHRDSGFSFFGVNGPNCFNKFLILAEDCRRLKTARRQLKKPEVSEALATAQAGPEKAASYM